YNLDRNAFRQILTQHTICRGLAQAVLIREDQSVVMAAEIQDPVEIPVPPPGAIEQAAEGRPVLFDLAPSNLIGAIIKLRELPDTYLYTLRLLDPQVLRAQRIVASNTDEYRSLEIGRAHV